MSERETLVEARDLVSGYGAIPVLHSISLHVEAGEVVAILGPNGAGKSTTLLTLAGELPVQSGEVTVLGKEGGSALFRQARNGLAYVTEERSVFMGLTVRENLRLGRGDTAAALELVPELERLLDRRVGLLSGGEQQYLTLARALASNPRLLFADELSLGLAPLILDRLLTLARAAADRGVGVLLVEQQARKALKVCDRGYVMARGEIVMEGTAAELTEKLPEIESAYLSVAEADSGDSAGEAATEPSAANR